MFYNPSAKDRKVIFEDYLSCDKNEMQSIVKKLKNNNYARLEILLRYPYTHEVIIPHV